MWYLPVSKLRTLRNWQYAQKAPLAREGREYTLGFYGQLEVLEGRIEALLFYAFLIWQPRETGITVHLSRSITTSKGKLSCLYH
jgi:hypothetical protein